jgi:tetratricopeptide (TPR) repeat protein
MHVLRRAICAALLLLPLASEAQRTYHPRDLALLPSYCQYTQFFRDSVPGGRNPAEIERWNTRTKGMFQHLHHYCWGLIALNQATFFARSPQEREHRLRVSINEFDYVLRRAEEEHPNFELLPEILTKKADSLIRLGKSAEGAGALQRAISLKPDYWPAYASLSDHYKALGDIPKARATLESGLSAAPNATPLKERLAELEAGRAPPKTR